MTIQFNSKITEYAWLSNMYLCDITDDDGAVWPSAEHLYASAKTEIPAEKKAILKAPSPFKAKRMGRDVTLREDWDEIKLDVMFTIAFVKFLHHEDLRQKLFDTGEEPLEEYAPWGDRFWGVDDTGIGENHMGKILMQVRDFLRTLGVDAAREIYFE